MNDRNEALTVPTDDDVLCTAVRRRRTRSYRYSTAAAAYADARYTRTTYSSSKLEDLQSGDLTTTCVLLYCIYLLVYTTYCSTVVYNR